MDRQHRVHGCSNFPGQFDIVANLIGEADQSRRGVAPPDLQGARYLWNCVSMKSITYTAAVIPMTKTDREELDRLARPITKHAAGISSKSANAIMSVGGDGPVGPSG